MRNLFKKIGKLGGYTARFVVTKPGQSMSQRYGEWGYVTEYGVHRWQEPGEFTLTSVVRDDGGFTNVTAMESIGQDLDVGDQLTILVQRWSMRGRAEPEVKDVWVRDIELVPDSPGFLLIRYGWNPPQQNQNQDGRCSDNGDEDDDGHGVVLKTTGPHGAQHVEETETMADEANETMTVKRSELVALLEQLQFRTASKWNKARLLGRIEKLPDVVDEETDAGDHQDLLDSLLDAVENEQEIAIEDDMKKTPARGTKASGKGTTSAKGKPAAKQPAAAKKQVERDRFGSKIGTQCNLINEVMTGKPQTTQAIAEASGMTVSRVKAHMTYLIQKGFVEKHEKGYKTTASAPRK